MKHFFITLILALATITGAAAQPSRRPSSYSGYTQYGTTSNSYENFFTFRAGANFSNLVDQYYHSKAQPGFNAAILYNISLMQDAPLYIQTGLSMEMKGAQGTNLLDNIASSDLKSYGVEIPLVATFDVPIGANMAIVPEFGLYYCYTFAGSLEGGGEFYRPYKKQEIEIYRTGTVNTRLFHRSDFGVRAGLSFRYSNTLIGFAYDAGFVNAFAKEFRDIGAQLMTGTWSLNVAYRFR